MDELKDRFLSLDVFRGMIICFMIIVNMPGNPETTVPALLNSRWNGLSPADLILPSFLFCMGMGTFFNVFKWQKEHSKAKVVFKILRTSIVLIIIGILLNWYPFFQIDPFSNQKTWIPFSDVRLSGLLQRVGLVYLLVSLMFVFFKIRTTLAVTVVILILYWPLLYYFGDSQGPYTLRGNLPLKIDTKILGINHLDQYSELVPFEMYGLLSTLPAIGNMVAGYLVGRFIKRKGITYETLTLLLLTGFLLLSLSYIWNNVFPVNMKLWTSSFVLQTIGIDLSILSLVIYTVDKVKFAKESNYFRVLGRNPLVAYILSATLIIPLQLVEVQPGVSIMTWLYINIFSYATAYVGSFLQSLIFMVIISTTCIILDRKKEYITV